MAQRVDDGELLTPEQVAQRLGQHRVVTMSGLPGGEPGATRPNWIVNAWNSAALDVLDYQWKVAADFWRERVEPVAARVPSFASWLVAKGAGPASLDAQLARRLKKPLAALRFGVESEQREEP